MAKITQILDVDSAGHKVLLDNGSTVRLTHDGEAPSIGDTVNDDSGDLLSRYPALKEALAAVAQDVIKILDDDKLKTEQLQEAGKRITTLESENGRLKAELDRRTIPGPGDPVNYGAKDDRYFGNANGNYPDAQAKAWAESEAVAARAVAEAQANLKPIV